MRTVFVQEFEMELIGPLVLFRDVSDIHLHELHSAVLVHSSNMVEYIRLCPICCNEAYIPSFYLIN